MVVVCTRMNCIEMRTPDCRLLSYPRRGSNYGLKCVCTCVIACVYAVRLEVHLRVVSVCHMYVCIHAGLLCVLYASRFATTTNSNLFSVPTTTFPRTHHTSEHDLNTASYRASNTREQLAEAYVLL